MPSSLLLIVGVLPRVVRATFAVVAILAFAEPALAQTIGAGSVPGGDYEIGPDDLLEISVWKEKDLQREVLVRPDGWLTFPLVGNIRAKGRTALDVQEEITTRLRKYIPDPVVSVSIKKVAGYKIYVIGKVNKPGEYVVGRYVDVLQALTLAGGLTPFAAESDIRVLRKKEAEDGTVKEVVLKFDYSDVKKGRDLQQNIVLKSGDVVVVP
jgi:polysaccharide export outer membrane protein